jgi:DNA invertase Pin-like site-specific DNA recombinase
VIAGATLTRTPAPAAPPSATAVATRTIRVALYGRVSTRDKDQDPQLQLVPMREYAAARGWEIVEYVDCASAGDLAGRTAWARLLEDARRRRLDHVLVWKLDRAFRSTLHCLSTLQELEHRGVGFSCLTQSDVDTTSPTGRLLLTLLAAVAEFERGLIRERVREGMVNARRKGAKIGRPSAAQRPAVARQLPGVVAEIAAGTLSKRPAAKRLGVGAPTLDRLLAATKGEGG